MKAIAIERGPGNGVDEIEAGRTADDFKCARNNNILWHFCLTSIEALTGEIERRTFLTSDMHITGKVTAALFFLFLAPQVMAEAFEIDIARPRFRVTSRQDVRFHCRSAKHVDGCTEFLGELLAARCERRETDWHIAAVARFIPYVYVISPALVAHEQLHLDDMTQQLQTFLAELTSRSFPDEGSCRSDADFESAVFTLRMDVLRAESNRRLH